jgi:hypothetical protein
VEAYDAYKLCCYAVQWTSITQHTNIAFTTHIHSLTASKSFTSNSQIKMQFSIFSIVAALAATSSAMYAPYNGTTTTSSAPYYPITTPTSTPAYYPTGTGTGAPVKPTTAMPYTGAAAMPTHMAGSALGVVVAGGIALVSLCMIG